MPWLTADEFKDLWVTESATEIPAAQITECLDSAKAEIVARVEADYVTALVADNDNSEDNSKSLRRAQSKLAYRELLFFRSSQFRSGGIAKLELDENASVRNEYEAFKDTELRRQKLLEDALGILEPFLTEEAEEEAAENESPRSTCKAINFGW